MYQFLNLQAITLIIYKQLKQRKSSELQIRKALNKKIFGGGNESLRHYFQIFEKKHELMKIVRVLDPNCTIHEKIIDPEEAVLKTDDFVPLRNTGWSHSENIRCFEILLQTSCCAYTCSCYRLLTNADKIWGALLLFFKENNLPCLNLLEDGEQRQRRVESPFRRLIQWFSALRNSKCDL